MYSSFEGSFKRLALTSASGGVPVITFGHRPDACGGKGGGGVNVG